MLSLQQVPLVSVWALVLGVHPHHTRTLNYLLSVHSVSYFYCP